MRQAKAEPVFDELEQWLHDQLPRISGKSPLAKAIRYSLAACPKPVPKRLRSVHAVQCPIQSPRVLVIRS
ncbi:transposase [uncultured Tateyamaria sp.]|uniref:IS66 family transposase n=1 Tax=uncultured Tateyamaria sp. TaxID=455651 RepID=UPI002636A30E|nr:transposase [uncultured Tateyamaria sp.]